MLKFYWLNLCLTNIFFCERWFKNFTEHDFARAGFKADSTVALDMGPLNQFSHAIEPHLRKLGLPVALKKGMFLHCAKPKA